MPHTSRKKKVTPYRKRHEETSEDGWTRVTRTGVRAKSNGLTQVTESYKIPAEDLSLSISKLKTRFESCLNQWTTTEARRKLHSVIENGLRRNGSGRVQDCITTAALMALGSLSRTNLELTTKSMWQLVVFIDVVRLLNGDRSPDDQIKLFAQDPNFTQLDKDFLRQTFSFEILEPPQILGLVHNKTFLYVPHLEWYVEIPYREHAIACPLYFTTPMDWVIDAAERSIVNCEGNGDKGDPQRGLDGAKAIKLGFEMFEFPELEFSDAMRGVVVYVRRSDEEQHD
ncbi:hypothetical protein MBLNU457_1413t1 [Dothideomycetes sp. NU457]